MCSVLLVFLIFAIAFDFAKDSVPNWIAAQTLPQGALCGQTCLVSASYGCCNIGPRWTPELGEEAFNPSFERSTLFETNQKTRKNGPRTLALEVRELFENQQEDGHRMRTLPFSLVDRHSPQNSTPSTAAAVSRPCLGGLGERRNIMESATDSIPIAIQIIQSKEPHQRKGWEEQSKKQKEPERRGEGTSARQDGAVSLRAIGSRLASMASSGRDNHKSHAHHANSADRRPQSRSSHHAQECLLRKQSHAAGGEGIHRAARKGDSEDCHQDAAFCNHGNGQSTENISRDPASKETAQGQVDGSHHGSNQNLAITASGLSETTKQSSRSGEQSQSGHRTVQDQHTAAHHHSSRCVRGDHADDSSRNGDRGCQSGRRQGGREAATSTADCSEIVRGVPRSRSTHLCRRIQCDGGSDKGGRRRKLQKAFTILRTLWWFASFGSQQIVNYGGVVPVQQNGSHDAIFQATQVEAYAFLPDSHAACPQLLTSFDSDALLAWQHSVQWEPNFVNQYAAVCNAWKCRWQILCEEFHEGMNHAPDLSILPGFCKKGQCPDFTISNIDTALNATHDAAPSFLSSELRSCIRCEKLDLTAKPIKRVRFCSDVSVHTGLEDDLHMVSVPFGIDDLKVWTDKPWKKSPKNPRRNMHVPQWVNS